MPFVVAGSDIETTGLKVEDGHRIIEVAMSLWRTDDGYHWSKMGKTWTQRINPLRSIEASAQAVHGITVQDLRGAPEWEDVAPKIAKFLSVANLLVAHNADFDFPFLGHELLRAGQKLPEGDVFCTMQNGREATALGKVPSLEELAWSFGYKYDTSRAHAADYDIDLTMKCFFDGLKEGFFTIPQLDAYRASLEAAA